MSAIVLAVLMAAGSFLIISASNPRARLALVSRLSKPDAKVQFFSFSRASIQQRFYRAVMPKAKLRSALAELPEILEMLVVALTAGDGIFAALASVTPRASGVLPTELQRLFIALELGGDMESELEDLAKRLPQRQVVEFAAKLSIALRRGSPLARMLREQAESARADLRNELLREVGRNETRMLIPLVFLILPVTVLFAVYPSLQLISLDYL